VFTGPGEVIAGPAGALIATHGFDQAQAGLRQLITGRAVQSQTERALVAVGVSPSRAATIDAGASMIGTLGATTAVSGARVAAITAPRIVVGTGSSGITANKAAGDAIRDAIAAREAPALTEQTFNTLGGLRRVDVLKLGNETLAIESKVGRTFLRARERQELARDWWLQRQGQVGSVRWEFSPSGVNNGVGPSPELQRMIDKLGFQSRINP
jgi:hypothetical protein